MIKCISVIFIALYIFVKDASFHFRYSLYLAEWNFLKTFFEAKQETFSLQQLFLSGSKSTKHKQRMSLFQVSHARGIFFLITLLLAANQVNALDAGEVVTLKDMQAEWGPQLGWTGSPSCSWNGVTCDPEGNVIGLYVLFQLHEATNPHQNSPQS